MPPGALEVTTTKMLTQKKLNRKAKNVFLSYFFKFADDKLGTVWKWNNYAWLYDWSVDCQNAV